MCPKGPALEPEQTEPVGEKDWTGKARLKMDTRQRAVPRTSLLPKPQVAVTSAVTEASHDHCPHDDRYWPPALGATTCWLDSEPRKPTFSKPPHSCPRSPSTQIGEV